jgi:4-alpha-glucanotransferase
MISERRSGILLHPTSLPGPDGIGDLGPDAFHWIDFLKDSGCGIWQILPLGPTGYGDSPYQAFSAFAGNPYLISPALLLDQGLLSIQDLSDRPTFPIARVDFGPVIEWKLTLLNRAYDHFVNSPDPSLQDEFEEFKKSESHWVEDFALFMAIKESQGGFSWDHWPEPLRKRDAEAIITFKKKHSKLIENHTFRQFIFARQWNILRNYAHKNGITIIGDAPIFVAYDSAEVWANPDLFFLDKNGLPTVVAGVPPDYFSTTGQLWGNPLYRWDVHKATHYSWWIARLTSILKEVDIVRLDHFRGFSAYWEIPFGMPTAEIGKWVNGPGADFFSSILDHFKELPIIAEDLGLITPDVVKLRDDFNLPGMKILQFAFSTDLEDPFLPHNYPNNCVAYTGTHDNDTSQGWFNTAPEEERKFCSQYVKFSGEDIPWKMIQSIWASPANLTLTTMQDFLSLDTEARMNYPGRPCGNWSWRLLPEQLTDDLTGRIHQLNRDNDRH